MRPTRYHHGKRDAAEPAIIETAEALGSTVVQHSGTGEPDLFISVPGFGNVWLGLEVKSSTQCRLTKEQQRFIGPRTIVCEPDDVRLALSFTQERLTHRQGKLQ